MASTTNNTSESDYSSGCKVPGNSCKYQLKVGRLYTPPPKLVWDHLCQVNHRLPWKINKRKTNWKWLHLRSLGWQSRIHCTTTTRRKQGKNAVEYHRATPRTQYYDDDREVVVNNNLFSLQRLLSHFTVEFISYFAITSVAVKRYTTFWFFRSTFHFHSWKFHWVVMLQHDATRPKFLCKGTFTLNID